MRNRLRLFAGDDTTTTTTVSTRPEITVSLGEVSRILADAVRTKRTWLRDFEDEEIQVSADLYEILTTYGNMRPCA